MAAGLKSVLKRPWLHHLIIICYIGAPFVNILLLVVFLHVTFATVFANLVAGYGILATVWLLTAPVVGISLYFVKRFSWYVFLGHSAIILLDFLVKWATRPAYYLHTVPGLHNVILLAGNICLVAFVSYIIQRDFRAPYFQVLNRSWREHERIPIHHTVTLNGQSRSINDLSTGGCFVLEPMSDRILGSTLTISSLSNSLDFVCSGEIMRITPAGIGVRFIRLPAVRRQEIRKLLRNRFALRQKVDVPCTWVFRYEESQSRIIDLSSSGCYVHALPAGLAEGSEGELRAALLPGRNPYSLPGTVAWINRNGAHGKPAGFGFRFAHKQAGFMKDAAAHFGQGVLVR